MDEEDKKLLASAHAVVRESQRRLHTISEEARLVYQRRLGEWERSRHSLEQIELLMGTQAPDLEVGLSSAERETRAGLLKDELSLRERHGELAEGVYSLQRTSRLLATAIRQLEKESARLVPGGDAGLLAVEEDANQAESYERIIQAHEQERMRLAREIHDGPAQILANAIFELDYFEKLFDKDPGSVREQLSQLKGDIRDGLAEVRRFIFDLRPPAFSEMGLFVALRRYVEDFQKHFGIPIDIDLPANKARIPTLQEVTIFRIVQEALQNAQKHASPTKIVLKAAMDSTSLSLTIEDNGRGFDVTEVASRHSKNLGLISMRERAGLIDARIRIDTAPGKGTRISLVVPLERGIL